VVAGDVVQAPPSEVRDQVLFDRPAVLLERARAGMLAVEPLARVVAERLPARLDPLAAPPAQQEFGAAGFGVFEAAVDDLPAAGAVGVEVAELVRRADAAEDYPCLASELPPLVPSPGALRAPPGHLGCLESAREYQPPTPASLRASRPFPASGRARRGGRSAAAPLAGGGRGWRRQPSACRVGRG